MQLHNCAAGFEQTTKLRNCLSTFFEKQQREYSQKLDPTKIAMNIALEAGGLDLYKRAKHLSGTQAKELVAIKQGDKIKSEFEEL